MSLPRPKAIFLTGASTGIGRALALEYAGADIRLGLVARRRELLEEVADLCRRRGAAVWWRSVDVRERSAIAAAGKDFLAWAGGVDLAIANAGGGRGGHDVVPASLTAGKAPADGDSEELLNGAILEAILRLNVTAVADTFAPFVPSLRATRRGQLAAVASLAGYRGMPQSAGYSASKAALISYMESLRIQLAADGVRVSTICPGYVRTPLTAQNPYMPYLLEPEAAARIIHRGLARGRSRIVFPWQLGLLLGLLRVAPNVVYDAFARRLIARRRRAEAAGPP